MIETYSKHKELIERFSHDIKTPLSAIKHGTQGLKIFLPKLLDAYDRAKSANLIEQEIQPQQLDILSQVLTHIESSAELISEQVHTLQKNYAHLGD